MGEGRLFVRFVELGSRSLRRGHLQRKIGIASLNAHFDRCARCLRSDEGEQLAHVVHVFFSYCQQHVTRLQACFESWTVLQNTRDDHALGLLDTKRFCQIGVQLDGFDANPAARDLAIAHQAFEC